MKLFDVVKTFGLSETASSLTNKTSSNSLEDAGGVSDVIFEYRKNAIIDYFRSRNPSEQYNDCAYFYDVFAISGDELNQTECIWDNYPYDEQHPLVAVDVEMWTINNTPLDGASNSEIRLGIKWYGTYEDEEGIFVDQECFDSAQTLEEMYVTEPKNIENIWNWLISHYPEHFKK